MQYGYCLSTKFIQGDALAQATYDAIVDAGYDYVELPLSALSEMPPSEVAKLKQALQAIPCKACNLFFPGSINIVGPQRDMSSVNAYLEKMLPLAASLGVETLVFGNGGARKIPDGQTREAIWDNLREVVEAMDHHARKTGIAISVEPLNHTETNIINSYGEAVDLTKGLTHVATMVDSYHVAKDSQSYDDVYKNPQALLHLHTAYPIGRMVPSPQDDIAIYADFVQMVKKLEYNGKISVEGALKATDPHGIKAEVMACLDVLKEML
ncbi:MAG: sugar phosphate isomerase/epimerase [Defluviitaleaceae bacterium]|nr:sugar phosphate isomerase/epimerase [Defluviitaleaceae bacterium]